MAADGEEGLRMIESNNYDLVLLDLALPGQSGLELLPQIKERQPELPVIMITATAPSTTSLKPSAQALKTSFKSPGTTKSSLPTFAPQSPATAPRRRTFSSSAPSSSVTTLRTSSAKASPCSRSLTSLPRSRLRAPRSSFRARANRQGTHRQGHSRQLAAPRQALRPHQHRPCP